MSQSSAKERQYQDEILEELRRAGRSGRTKTGLPARTGSPARQNALNQLVKAGQVTARRMQRGLRYWLPAHAPSLETVEESLHKACDGRKPGLLTEQELKRLLPEEEQSLLKEALPHLVADRAFHEFRRGKTRYYLYLPAFWSAYDRSASSGKAAESGPDASTRSESTPRPSFSSEAVQRAYERVTARNGYPFVMIHRLREESGQDLAALQRYLLEEWGAGRAELSEADWSIASDAERAAAIVQGRERYLNVRLRSGSRQGLE